MWDMRKNIKLDIVISYKATACFFVVSRLNKCKTIDFSVFVGISFAIAFKRRKLDYG